MKNNWIGKMLPVVTAVGSVVGVGLSVYLAIKETPNYLVVKEELEPFDKDVKGNVREFVRSYKKTITMSLITTGLIVGSSILNHKQQAALLALYKLQDVKGLEYKEKIKEFFGPEKELEARNSKNEIEVVPDSDALLFREPITNTFFWATPYEILYAKYYINRILAIRGHACLNEFLELVGAQQTMEGEDFGWQLGKLYPTESDYYCEWIDISYDECTLDSEDSDLLPYPELTTNDSPSTYYELYITAKPVEGYKEL